MYTIGSHTTSSTNPHPLSPLGNDSLLPIDNGKVEINENTLQGAFKEEELSRITQCFPLIITSPIRTVNNDGSIQVKGETTFLGVNNLSIVVSAFKGTAALNITIRITLIDGIPFPNSHCWKFSQSFPNLPIFNIHQSGNTNFLDTLDLSHAAFVITNQKGHDDTVTGAELKPGLNFVAKYQPKTFMGLIANFINLPEWMPISGLVHFPKPHEEPPTLSALKFPWQLQDPVPGITLKAVLINEVSIFGSDLKLNQVALHVYCPHSKEWAASHRGFSPTLAASAKLKISENLSPDVTILGLNSSQSLFILGSNLGVTLNSLAELINLSGSELLLPPDIAIGELSLDAISLSIDQKMQISSLELDVGIPNISSKLVPGLVIKDLTVSFGISFVSSRSLTTSMRGIVEFLDAPFCIEMDLPFTTARGTLKGSQTIPLNALFEKFGFQSTNSDLKINYLEFIIDQSRSYSMTAHLGMSDARKLFDLNLPGDIEWGKIGIPNLNLIGDLGIEIDEITLIATDKQIAQFSIAVRSELETEIAKFLTISKPSLSLTIYDILSDTNRKYEWDFSVDVKIGGVLVYLTSNHESPLKLTGDLPSANLQDLLTPFNLKIPPIQGINWSAICFTEGSFDLELAKNKKFSIEGKASLGSTDLEIKLCIFHENEEWGGAIKIEGLKEIPIIKDLGINHFGLTYASTKYAEWEEGLALFAAVNLCKSNIIPLNNIAEVLKLDKPIDISICPEEGIKVSSKNVLPDINLNFMQIRNPKIAFELNPLKGIVEATIPVTIPVTLSSIELTFFGNITFGSALPHGEFKFSSENGIRLLSELYLKNLSIEFDFPDKLGFSSILTLGPPKKENLKTDYASVRALLGVAVADSEFEAQFPQPFRLGLNALLTTLFAGEMKIPEWLNPILNPITLSGFMNLDDSGNKLTKPEDYHPLEVHFVPSKLKFGFVAKLKMFSMIRATIEAAVDKEEGIIFKGYMTPLIIENILEITASDFSNAQKPGQLLENVKYRKGPYCDIFIPGLNALRDPNKWKNTHLQFDGSIYLLNCLKSQASISLDKEGLLFKIETKIDLAVLSSHSSITARINQEGFKFYTHFVLVADLTKLDLGKLNILKDHFPTLYLNADIHFSYIINKPKFTVHVSVKVMDLLIDFDLPPIEEQLKFEKLCEKIIFILPEKLLENAAKILEKLTEEIVEKGLEFFENGVHAFQEFFGEIDGTNQKFKDIDESLKKHDKQIAENRSNILKLQKEFAETKQEISEQNAKIKLQDAKIEINKEEIEEIKKNLLKQKDNLEIKLKESEKSLNEKIMLNINSLQTTLETQLKELKEFFKSELKSLQGKIFLKINENQLENKLDALTSPINEILGIFKDIKTLNSNINHRPEEIMAKVKTFFTILLGDNNNNKKTVFDIFIKVHRLPLQEGQLLKDNQLIKDGKSAIEVVQNDYNKLAVKLVLVAQAGVGLVRLAYPHLAQQLDIKELIKTESLPLPSNYNDPVAVCSRFISVIKSILRYEFLPEQNAYCDLKTNKWIFAKNEKNFIKFKSPNPKTPSQPFPLCAIHDLPFWTGLAEPKQLNGPGKLFFSNNKSLDCDWLDGKVKGKGQYFEGEKALIQAVWSEDNMQISDIKAESPSSFQENPYQELNDASSYKGEWDQNFLPHGKGEIHWKNGDKFKGKFNEGHIIKGTKTFNNGGYYEGYWSGKGYLEEKNGKYSGYFKEGKKHGKGRYDYANKSYYYGEWKNDLKQGTGTFVHDSKNNEEMVKYENGKWVEDKFQSENLRKDLYNDDFIKAVQAVDFLEDFNDILSICKEIKESKPETIKRFLFHLGRIDQKQSNKEKANKLKEKLGL